MKESIGSGGSRRAACALLCAVATVLPLFSGCFESGLTHEELKGPDPLPAGGIFGVHAWWHLDDRVTLRWYVLNSGEETWELYLLGGSVVSGVDFSATGRPDEAYRKVQYVPRQVHDPPVPPGTVLEFQYTFEHPSNPNGYHMASTFAWWSGGFDSARTFCLAKAPPLDVRACALEQGAHPTIDEDERLLWPRLRNETGWLPPPVDVPEAACRLDAGSVRCDHAMWNWDNASATVDAEVTLRLVSDDGANQTWGYALLGSRMTFDPYEVRRGSTSIPLEAQAPMLEEGARLEAVFRAWRSDLPRSVSESTFEVLTAG